MTSPLSNGLLALLPDSDYERIRPKLKLVGLSKGDILFRAGEPIHCVYFPVGAVISMSTELADGFGAETLVVGNTGMVGIGALGVGSSFNTATVIECGLAYELSLNNFQQEYSRGGAFMHILLMGVRDEFAQMSQSLICSKRHSLAQQLARWILTVCDRSASDTITASHSEIGFLLGFRREGVSLALRMLAESGLISSVRRQVKVTNRPGLEQMACECYREISRQTPRDKFLV
jgi:CRP-like cAMP-binding protein